MRQPRVRFPEVAVFFFPPPLTLYDLALSTRLLPTLMLSNAFKRQLTNLGRKCTFSSEVSSTFRPFTRFNNPDLPKSPSFPQAPFTKSTPNPTTAAFLDEDVNAEFSLSPASISTEAFPEQIAQLLQSDLNPEEIEIRSDGFLYLPEIRYRQLLLKAFGVGGWSLIPKGAHALSNEFISREYWLFCHGKFIAAARGFGLVRTGAGGELSDAAEAAKSNALMRCCKDLGIAKELWNPEYVKKWKEAFASSYTSQDGKRTLWKKRAVSE